MTDDVGFDHDGETCGAEALPCPFCSAQPKIQPWHGGGPRKQRIGCSNEACLVQPSVCGSTRTQTLAAWNYRDGGKVKLTLTASVKMLGYLDEVKEWEGYGGSREEVAGRFIWDGIGRLIEGPRLKQR